MQRPINQLLQEYHLFLSVFPLFTIWLVGQIVGDRNWFSAICFYIPAPFVIVTLVITFFVACLKHFKKAGICAAFLIIPPAYSVVNFENDWRVKRQEINPKYSVRVVHWNVMGGDGVFQESMVEKLRELSAGIYILSECSRKFEVALLKTLDPEYTTLRLSTMTVFAKEKATLNEWHKRTKHSKIAAINWVYSQRSYSSMLVDLTANICVDKQPHLNEIFDLLNVYQPNLLIGDFNTPRRSTKLRRLPDNYVHAYHSAGSGIVYMACTIPNVSYRSYDSLSANQTIKL